MPFFSIIVPAYNRPKGLKKTVRSILQSSFDDYEIIVVDDASTDKTLTVAKRIQKTDARVKIIEHKTNAGTHMARKTGVDKATGEYILFVDADDEITTNLLEKIHQNITITGNEIVCFNMEIRFAKNKKNADKEFEARFNRPIESCDAKGLLKDAFEKPEESSNPWIITAKAIKGSIAKSGFKKTSNERLIFGEDAYELLEMLSVKNSSVGSDPIVGYIYNMGSGITGSKKLSVKTFESIMDAAFAVLENSKKALPNSNSSLARAKRRAFIGLRKKLLSNLLNHWHDGLSPKNKARFVEEMDNSELSSYLSKELYRRLRDESYALWAHGKTILSLRQIMKIGDSLRERNGKSTLTASEDIYKRFFYRNMMDNFGKKTAKTLFWKTWKEYAIPHFSQEELPMLTREKVQDREIIPIALSDDAVNISTLRRIFKNTASFFSENYYWDIIAFEAGIQEEQKRELLKNCPENVRLSFISIPRKLAELEFYQELDHVLPYAGTLWYTDEKNFSNTDSVIAYFDELSTPHKKTNIVLRSQIKAALEKATAQEDKVNL